MRNDGKYAERPVAEVWPGDTIVFGDWDENGFTPQRSARSNSGHRDYKVNERVPCPGGNGMQVHLNKSDCWDSRAIVTVRLPQ